ELTGQGALDRRLAGPAAGEERPVDVEEEHVHPLIIPAARAPPTGSLRAPAAPVASAGAFGARGRGLTGADARAGGFVAGGRGRGRRNESAQVPGTPTARANSFVARIAFVQRMPGAFPCPPRPPAVHKGGAPVPGAPGRRQARSPPRGADDASPPY